MVPVALLNVPGGVGMHEAANIAVDVNVHRSETKQKEHIPHMFMNVQCNADTVNAIALLYYCLLREE
jgi:hypothetical protein